MHTLIVSSKLSNSELRNTSVTSQLQPIFAEDLATASVFHRPHQPSGKPATDMKSLFLVAVITISTCCAVPLQNQNTVTLQVIEYEDIMNVGKFGSSGADEVLKRAMTADGLVGIRGIPNFKKLRHDALLGSYECAKHATTVKTVDLDDGTQRRTIAGVARGSARLQDLEFGEDDGICLSDFQGSSTAFRHAVSAVAGAFSDRMSELFTLEGVPMLWHVNQTKSYQNFRDIVNGADHLEHFHTYRQTAPARHSSTIDLHTDQGMFIAFTPALMVADDPAGKPRLTGSSAGEFFIEQEDKTRAVVDFADGDMLVFMLGDGVEQYYNNRLKAGKPRLRPAPHGMSMPEQTAKESRVWYGRMFLPPKDALNEEYGTSFGEVRQRAIHDVHAGGGVGSGIGCSRHLLQEDADPECGENQMYCWHRCMDHTLDCESQGLKLQCMNQRNQLVDVATHGDHNPTCSDSETLETDPDPIEQPSESLSCDAGNTWVDYLDLDSYDNSLEIHKGKTYLMWNVVDGSKVNMRMAYNGYLGYMAVGIADKRTREQGSSHPGMNGANTIMGVYDPDPNVFGAPFVGTGVKAYTIHPDLSAFRHWDDETSEDLPAGATMDVSDCFMSMSFTVPDIHGQALNFTAGTTNDLIWAIHEDSLLKGYHGYCNKGRFTLDFTATSGHGSYPWPPAQGSCGDPAPEEEGGSDDSDIEDPEKKSAAAAPSAQWLLAAVVASATLLLASESSA